MTLPMLSLSILLGLVCAVAVVGIHLEEVVEDGEQHGTAAEEDGERVQPVVGDHGAQGRPEG